MIARLAAIVLLAGATVATATPSTVTVPSVHGRDVAGAYSRLHRAGLRVSVPRAIKESEFCLPDAAGVRPAVGARVARGSAVTLRIHAAPCGAGSPGVPTGGVPSYKVPDFRGWPVSTASKWAKAHGIEFDATLPALRAGAAPTLLDNYIVRSQRPRAGKRLSAGVAVPGGGFRVTPLTVTAVQTLDGVLTGSILFVGSSQLSGGHKTGGRVAVFASPRVAGSGPPYFAAGRRVATATVRAGHSYRFVLPAGRYIVGRVGGSDCPPNIVIVWPGRTAHLDVDVGCTVA